MPEQLADGLYYNMSFEEYASIPALNGSALVHMRRSPMYFRYKMDNPEPPTPAMVLGTATHRLILEPDRVGDFAVWGLLEEEKVRRGKVWDSFCELNKGAMIVTVAERDAMVGMAAGARRNLPILKYANAKGRTEVSMFWTENGRRFKGRIDKLLDGRHTICDLKTTRSCQRHAFGSQSYKLGYHIKMGLYWRGYRALTGHDPHMKLLAIESKAPHESAVYRITSDVLLQGLEDADALIKTLAECEATNRWPAEQEEETDLQLPIWATTTENTEDFAMEGLEIE